MKSLSNEQVLNIDSESLRDYCIKLLNKEGVPEEEAFYMADSLVVANLRGVDSHGVSRMPIYMKRLREGLVNRKCSFEVQNEAPGSMLVDAQNSLGPVVGVKVMERAIEKAKESGSVMVGVKNSNHYGTASYFSMLALKENMIGISASNAPSTMAPWGGIKPFLGTNPFSFAIPTGNEKPIVIDMATSVVARGKIILAAKNGQKIPEGWAINKEGEVTTDAEEALVGSVLPFAGPKGYAISLLIDILAGILSGGPYGPHINNLYENFKDPQCVGHFFGVINIEKFIPVENFKSMVDRMIREIKGAPKGKNTKEIFLPGEIEYNIQTKRLQEGIPITIPVLDDLKELGEIYSVPFTVKVVNNG
ncbi:MAG: hypothetical protein PWR27_193 [Petroclostridium sp.]|nr:hypothetical protein [Petroclostridium sp.]